VFFAESLDKLDFASNIEVIYAQNLRTDIWTTVRQSQVYLAVYKVRNTSYATVR
jgi:hypothetical protein